MKAKNLFITCITILCYCTNIWADVEINETNFPDVNFRNWLLKQPYGADSVLKKKEIASIKEIKVSNLGIRSLKGIEFFKALENLYCDNNQLTELDVSKNSELWILVCHSNKIKDTAMDKLVKSLPKTGNAPRTLYTNKDWTKLIKEYFTILLIIWNENEQNVMTAAQVAAAKAKGWIPKAYNGVTWFDYAGYGKKAKGLKINEENFPDKNFRSWILSQKFGSDSVLTTTEIANITFIRVNGKNIQSLKGIEYFPYLKHLICNDNQLSALDVSKNRELEILVCSGNLLTALDVLQNTALKELRCNSNQLSTLDVSQNTALKSLWCHANKLATINISMNTALKELNCSENQLTALDITKNIALKALNCGENQLTALDMSRNTELTHLFCYCNQLKDLKMSKNSSITQLYCYGNQLTTLDVSMGAVTELLCDNNKLTSLKVSKYMDMKTMRFHQNQIKGEAMDAFVESLPTVRNKKMYVIYHTGEQNVMTSAQVKAVKAKGWIPYYFDGHNWQEYAGSNK